MCPIKIENVPDNVTGCIFIDWCTADPKYGIVNCLDDLYVEVRFPFETVASGSGVPGNPELGI